MKLRTKIAILLAGFAFARPAAAQVIVFSQETLTGLADYSPTGFGQSFTANGFFSMSAVDLYMSASFGGSNITVTLHSFNPVSSTIGAPLATGTLLETELLSSASWERITFSTPVSLIQNASYAFIVVAADPGGMATGWNNYGVNSANVYPGGNRLNISSGVISPHSTDLAFRVVAVPEPAAPLLALSGLAVLVGFRSRRAARLQGFQG